MINRKIAINIIVTALDTEIEKITQMIRDNKRNPQFRYSNAVSYLDNIKQVKYGFTNRPMKFMFKVIQE